ncbi:MAG: TolC family protein [FCB group bacterium]|nr:TolC family protein [FCB group bacterium]
MKFKYFFIILVCFGITISSAAVSEVQLTLDELISKALEHNHEIQISRLQLKGAESTAAGAFAGFLPSVNLYMNQDLNNRTSFGLPSAPDTSDTGLDSLYNFYDLGSTSTSSTTLSINETLFDGARSWYANRNVKNFIHQAKLNLDAQVEKVVLDVKTAYFRYLSALEQKEVADFSLELADSQLELVQQQYDLQAVSETDLLKARVRRGQAEASVLLKQQDVKAARNEICIAVGETAGCSIGIGRIDIFLSDLPAYEDAKRELLRDNTQLQLADITVIGRELAYKTQISVFLPIVSLGVNYTARADNVGDQFDGLLKTPPSSTLNLSFPIFKGFSNKSRLYQLKYDLLSAENNVNKLRKSLLVQLDNLLTALDTYHRLIPINEEIITSARLDVELVEKKYHLGSSDILDVLNAQNSLIQAQSDLVQIKHDAKILEAQLEVLLGRVPNGKAGN